MATAEKLIGKMTDRIFKGVTTPARGPAYLALCRSFPLVEITSKAQHETALKVIERLIDFSSTPDAAPLADDVQAYLSVLVDLVEKYEKERFPTERAKGREVLAYLMQSHGLTQSDLAKELGGQSVVSSILRGERDLNVRQIQALAKRFKVSGTVFLDLE